MDSKKIESFLAIAGAGKYSTAAERLFTSQSALSKQMRLLESEVGAPLFKKTGSGVELTQAGWEFYYYARKAIPELQQTLAHIKAISQEDRLPFRLGALPLVEDYGFSDCFCSFWAENPSIQIDYFERSQEDLLRKLERNTIDLALTRLDLLDPARFSSQRILTDDMVLVVNKRNLLSRLESVDIDMLRNETFILPAERSDLNQIFVEACMRHGFHPLSPLRHSRHRMLLKAVQRNMGSTVLPRGMTSSIWASDVVCIPLVPTIQTSIGFTWISGTAPSQITRKFMDFVCASYAV